MRQFGLHIIILAQLTACSGSAISDESTDQHPDTIPETTTELIESENSEENNQATLNEQNYRFPEKSEINNPKYSTDFLLKSWAHTSKDDEPAFTIDHEFFRIIYNDTIANVKYIVEKDSIEIFEYHHGHTSKGTISKLTTDSLVINWSTGDRGRYVKYEE